MESDFVIHSYNQLNLRQKIIMLGEIMSYSGSKYESEYGMTGGKRHEA